MMKNEKMGYLYRFRALLYKDICDLRWNGQVLFNLITGAILISLFALLPHGEIPISFVFTFVFGMLTLLMQGNLVVEEKEQGTIRRLKQAEFSLKEILFSKMMITFMTTVLILILFFVLYGNHMLFHLQLFILVLPIIMIMLVAGTFLGIKTKNTIEVSLYGSPIMIFYFFLEGLLMNSSREGMPWLAIFPNYHIHYGIDQIYNKEPFLSYLTVPVIWMAVGIVVFITWYKKQHFN